MAAACAETTIPYACVLQVAEQFYVPVTLDGEGRIVSIITGTAYNQASPAHQMAQKAAKLAPKDHPLPYDRVTTGLETMITVCQPQEKNDLWYPAAVNTQKMRVFLKKYNEAAKAVHTDLGDNYNGAILNALDIATHYNMKFEATIGPCITKAVKKMLEKKASKMMSV